MGEIPYQTGRPTIDIVLPTNSERGKEKSFPNRHWHPDQSLVTRTQCCFSHDRHWPRDTLNNPEVPNQRNTFCSAYQKGGETVGQHARSEDRAGFNTIVMDIVIHTKHQRFKITVCCIPCRQQVNLSSNTKDGIPSSWHWKDALLICF